MRSITVQSALSADKMVLSFDSECTVVTVGQQRFEFDTKELWDLAKRAVLESTELSSGMTRRKDEAKVAIATTNEEFILHLHWCPCCCEYCTYPGAPCGNDDPIYCVKCIMHENFCHAYRVI